MEASSPPPRAPQESSPPETNDDPGPRSSQTAALLVTLDSVHTVHASIPSGVPPAGGTTLEWYK